MNIELKQYCLLADMYTHLRLKFRYKPYFIIRKYKINDYLLTD